MGHHAWAITLYGTAGFQLGRYVKKNNATIVAGNRFPSLWCYIHTLPANIDGLDIEQLSRRYGPMVLRRCRRLLRDDAEALDACQDVFVRLLERRHRLDDRYPSSLLFRMATNVCLNRIRDRGRRREDDDERLVTIACAAEPGALSDARIALEKLFGRHPESSRTMAVLHYLDGLTLEEVASEVGMSVSGVRRRLRLLRATLKEMDA